MNQLGEVVDSSLQMIENEKGSGQAAKTIKDISPTTISKNVYLESEQDIEDFLADLKQQLQATLSLGVRIRIK